MPDAGAERETRMTAAYAVTPATAAARLRKLAKERRLADRAPQLNALADALAAGSGTPDAPDGGPGIERWAGIDLFSAFLQEDTIGPAVGVRRWLGPPLDIAIQILFFIPIAVTWIGLMQATLAYRQALRLRAFAGKSFLEGWQSGFQGKLPKPYYLDRIALYVVCIIVLLMVLIVIHFFYRSKPDEDERARLHRELAGALTDADLQLAPLRISAPAEAAAALHKATAGFTRTAATIREVGETAASVQREAVGGLTALVKAMAQVEMLSTSMQAAAGKIDHSSLRLEERLSEISTTTSAIAAAEVELVRQIGVSSDRLSGGMDGLVRRFQDAATENQREMSSAIGGSSEKITDALTAGAAHVREVFAEVTAAAAAYTGRVEHAADVLGKAGDTVSEMPRVVIELKDRVADLGGRITDLEKAIAVARAAIPRAEGFPASAQDAIRDLRAAADGLRATTEALRNVSSARPRRRFGREPVP
jgi:hypothetical protein